jgi:pimeloyl-ACP methyl ester carboxylesterase
MKTEKPHPKTPAPSQTVFLHGFSGDGDGLRAFADAYSGKAAHCVNLPGFGGVAAPAQDTGGDIRDYCQAVWVEVRRVVPEGDVYLVGHSHGAMIGYVLALQHPDDIAGLDLFCPVVRPRFVPRFSIGFLYLLRRIGLPVSFIIKFVAHPILVSLVTRYSFQPSWSHEVRDQIMRMREREARFYSPVMFDLMEQTLRFQKDMNETRCEVPMQICYVTDENVAGDDDYAWYKERAPVRKSVAMTGGHLCVVADPRGVTRKFKES